VKSGASLTHLVVNQCSGRNYCHYHYYCGGKRAIFFTSSLAHALNFTIAAGWSNAKMGYLNFFAARSFIANRFAMGR
jgi:hypothetical protein